MNNDRLEGALYGLAVGDALGAVSEFLNPRDVETLRKNQPAWPREYGWHRKWKKGEYTDDTDMTLAIIRGGRRSGAFDVNAIVGEFLKWYAAVPKDVGVCVNYVLGRISKGVNWYKAGHEYHLHYPNNISNGALMRNAAIGIHWHDASLEAQFEYTILQALITHHHMEAVLPCLLHTHMLKRLLAGSEEPARALLEEALEQTRDFINKGDFNRLIADWLGRNRNWEKALDKGAKYLLGDLERFNPYRIDYRNQAGYAWLTLQIALWSLKFESYREGIEKVVVIGADADTYAAVAGSLLGARFGFAALPENLRANLLPLKLD